MGRVVACAEVSSTQRFMTHAHTELGKVSMISRFRSGMGHDYSTEPDSCCSMKHYFDFGFWDWSQVMMFAPCNGTVAYWQPELLPNSGFQLGLTPTGKPDMMVSMFHLAGNASSYKNGTVLTAGQYLANHTGSITDSDLAVRNLTSNTLLSFFQFIDDSVMELYAQHCVKDRHMMTIPSADRLKYPLSPCPGGVLNTSAPHFWPDTVVLC